jgi:hypothetical protein
MHRKPVGSIKITVVFDAYTANKLDLLFIFEKGIKKPHSFCCAVSGLKTLRLNLLAGSRFFGQHDVINKRWKTLCFLYNWVR